jgi:iron complex outermembrane recepter protein
MNNLCCKAFLYTAAACALLPIAALPVLAQVAADPGHNPAAANSSPVAGRLKEIIVTARRRQERLLNVPVDVTAVTRATLTSLQVTQIGDLPSLVPGLVIGNSIGDAGPFLTIHGIGDTEINAGVDSSVAFVIDGQPMGAGLAFQSALFDLSEIQVLKGPQTLFYGKSSPGGVISISTADPTDKDELIATEGYNFGTMGPLSELILSGPVTDTLKLRLASMFSEDEGYFHNEATPDLAAGALGPSSSRAPNATDWIVRGTLLWNPTSRFTARLKINLVGDYASEGQGQGAEITSCPEGRAAPFGIPFLAGANCGLSSTMHLVNMNPVDFPGIPNDGVPYISIGQRFGTLELNDQLSPDLDLISVTGFYHMISNSLYNDYDTSSAPPALVTPTPFRRQDFTEEIRVNSDFSAPVNFTAGAFFQKAHFTAYENLIGDVALGIPAELGDTEQIVPIEAHSIYGELRWKIVPQLEFAGGLRWSVESRSESFINLLTAEPSPVTVLSPTLHSHVISPQITLTYKPQENVTLYAAWKKGYLSGSYSTAPAVTNNTVDNGFGDEFVKGEEAGIKTRLLDDHLALNMTAYDYGYTGLQVGTVAPLPAVTTVTVNAGAARTYGVDFDATYRPPVLEALTLNASVGWDNAVYTTLINVPCWGGQTIAEGCTQDFDPATGLYEAQDLSGTQMVRAPKWQTNFGFQYNVYLGADYMLTVTNNNLYSARFPTFLAVGRPDNDNFQGGYAKIDLSAQVTTPGDRWEFSVIGDDINNKITAEECSNADFDTEFFGGEITGGTAVGPAGIDGVSCFVDPGRETWIRVTFKPSVHW